MKTKLILVAVMLITLPSLKAEAKSSKSSGGSGFYFDETFFPVLVDGNETTSFTAAPGAANETGSGLNSKTTLGYVFGGSWFIGATYNYYSLTTKRSNRVGGDSGKDEKTESAYLGPTLGWLSGNWRVMATAFLSGEKTVETKNSDNTGVTGNVKFTNKEASGFQLLAGYAFPITSGFSIGPTLAYRTLTFAKQSKVNRLNSAEDYSDVSLYSDYTETDLDFMLTLAFRF